MAKSDIQNGQAEYGIIHVDEQAMRDAGVGVFEESSTEAGQKHRRNAEPAPANKAEGAAPANKATVSAATAGSSSRQAAKRKAAK